MTVSEPPVPASFVPPPGSAGEPVDAALLDALDDLAHDLGRHIRLPLALLPIDAPRHDVEAAVEKAVHRTRTGPRGVFGAEELLEDFLSGIPEVRRPECAAIEAAVTAAATLARTRPLPDREHLRAAFEAVAAAIAALGTQWRSPACR